MAEAYELVRIEYRRNLKPGTVFIYANLPFSSNELYVSDMLTSEAVILGLRPQDISTIETATRGGLLDYIVKVVALKSNSEQTHNEYGEIGL